MSEPFERRLRDELVEATKRERSEFEDRAIIIGALHMLLTAPIALGLDEIEIDTSDGPSLIVDLHPFPLSRWRLRVERVDE